ncbi:AI-2E family transporter [Bythopirellula polymerisocia]|uniref:Putative inner membrane protein n=1 Tax=Bythopirellula polymerisocia TaxID=2528003 RepID=A0A5C6CVF5_9BACT|nr:AI-2E family transporter [Bythopirellula polymerisocia]TWU27654.1 putative inner membrane protein [Bythopirellula polymerisocia]
MSRQMSLYLLLATVLLIGILFYQVIQPFVFSLLFAIVLAVLFRPPYQWVVAHMKSHRRLAAVATTLVVMLLILLPIGGALVLAGAQLAQVASDAANLAKEDNSGEDSDLKQNLADLEQSKLAKTLDKYYHELPAERRRQVDDLISRAGDGFVKRVIEKTASFAGDLVDFTIGFFVTGLALYYFLADGKMFLQQLQSFLPLDAEEQEILVEQFGKVCRAVILGTVFAALAQALLAGIGFMMAGVPNVFLLMAVTMFFAFIPFVGGSSLVILVSAWLALEGRYLAGGLLFTYCVLLISTSDNLIRAYVIGSEAKMNPLVAFITVLGAIQLIGLVGIFNGPMIAALFYTLLKLLRERIAHDEAPPVTV